MEKTATEILWTNSVDKHNLRYTTMFLMEIRAHMRPPVCLESVWWWCGDTQRRMCETRRETNRDCTAQSHKDVKEDWCISRRTRTWQTYKGKLIKEDPHHHHCPAAAAAGTNSWCFYQRAVANGEEPGSHRENVHSTGSWRGWTSQRSLLAARSSRTAPSLCEGQDPEH